MGTIGSSPWSSLTGLSLVEYARPSASTHLLTDGRWRGRSTRRACAPRCPNLVAGLNAIHHLGIVHCDIKPSHVLVTAPVARRRSGFRLVSETAARIDADSLLSNMDVLARRLYRAPSRSSRERQAASDRLVQVGGFIHVPGRTGELPFTGSSTEIIEAKQDQRPCPPWFEPRAPKDLSALTMKLLEPDPLQRHLQSLVRYVGELTPGCRATRWRQAPRDLVGRDRRSRIRSKRSTKGVRDETVIALVSGASAMGKTALVRSFWESSG